MGLPPAKQKRHSLPFIFFLFSEVQSIGLSLQPGRCEEWVCARNDLSRWRSALAEKGALGRGAGLHLLGETEYTEIPTKDRPFAIICHHC